MSAQWSGREAVCNGCGEYRDTVDRSGLCELCREDLSELVTMYSEEDYDSALHHQARTLDSERDAYR